MKCKRCGHVGSNPKPPTTESSKAWTRCRAKGTRRFGDPFAQQTREAKADAAEHGEQSEACRVGGLWPADLQRNAHGKL